MIKREVECFICPSPEELGREFMLFNAGQQAMFFSEVAKSLNEWGVARVGAQLNAVKLSPRLSHDGGQFLRMLAEYTEGLQ